jgi:hypothetical protein
MDLAYDKKYTNQDLPIDKMDLLLDKEVLLNLLFFLFDL